ncbi:hypothetical protein O9929_26325 [Vibrio lentus]|nr:hypothetical protein [Vibrio lentus]
MVRAPVKAAMDSAREIKYGLAIFHTAAVYAPIGFMGGLTGKPFTEFAFTWRVCLRSWIYCFNTGHHTMCSKS